MLAARGVVFRSGARAAFTGRGSAAARRGFSLPRLLGAATAGCGIWLLVDPVRRSRVIAHLEAATRAARLLSTCVAIARDYKAARSWTADDVDDDVRAVASEHNHGSSSPEKLRWREFDAGGGWQCRCEARAKQYTIQRKMHHRTQAFPAIQS